MDSENKSIDWDALRAPFKPSEVDFRIQGNPQDGKTTARVVAYIDARTVQDRLDAVVGPLNWAFDWQPVIIKGDVVMAAKGILTICGVSKADVGDPGNTEPSKACVSDSLKRAAVQWGIGRYLYDLGTYYAEVKKWGNSWVLADGELSKLRAKLSSANAPTRPAQVTTQAQQSATNGNGTSSELASLQTALKTKYEGLGLTLEDMTAYMNAHQYTSRNVNHVRTALEAMDNPVQVESMRVAGWAARHKVTIKAINDYMATHKVIGYGNMWAILQKSSEDMEAHFLSEGAKTA